MRSPETLVVLNEKFEEKARQDREQGDAEFEEAKKLDTRNKD
jgi:hypothetical protein